MNKSSFFFSALLISVAWFSGLLMQGMELNLMFQFPDEIWGKIVPADYWGKKQKLFSSDSVSAVYYNIKNLRLLRLTCKTLNNLLTFKRIGNICTNYDKKRKNETFDYLSDQVYGRSFYSFDKYVASLILFCAEVDEKNKRGALLLKDAVWSNNKQFVEILFQNKVSPNIRNDEHVPLFMFAQTVEMAEMFLKYGGNMNAIDPVINCNVLSVVLYPKYPFELMKFYLKNGVDTEFLNKNTNACLLHQLVDQCFRKMNWFWPDCGAPDENDLFYCSGNYPFYYAAANQKGNYKINNFLQKGKLLLEAMSQKTINRLNKNGETAIGIAQKYLEQTMKKRPSLDNFLLECKLFQYNWPEGSSGKNFFSALKEKYDKDQDAKSFLQASKIYFIQQRLFDHHPAAYAISRETGEYERAEVLGRLIDLYREYGCLTAQELEQKRLEPEQKKLKRKRFHERMFVANILFFLVYGIKIVSIVPLVAYLMYML